MPTPTFYWTDSSAVFITIPLFSENEDSYIFLQLIYLWIELHTWEFIISILIILENTISFYSLFFYSQRKTLSACN